VQQIAELQAKLAILEQQLYNPTDIINPLVPLIVELLQQKSKDMPVVTLEALLPIIDEAIRQRSIQAPEKMSMAIADVLPGAIMQKILDSPEAIAKAIAPEIGTALQEQIRLDQDALSRTLGPEMGKAIKVQIRHEEAAMVDALYPVIGSTISKYMAEVVSSINERVETALSPAGILRKIRARIQGISEAELILRESVQFTVQGIFLIQKASGLVIQEVQPATEHFLESSMLAGMLTAIRSFVNDCITKPGRVSELHEIDYDDSKIMLEVAGYCYLAVIVKGQPSKPFIENIRHTLGQIILSHGEAIADYDGDPTSVPSTIKPELEKLTESKAKQRTAGPPVALLLLLLAILGTWGFFAYRSWATGQLQAKVLADLDASPELSVYRLNAEVEGKTLTLAGKLPNASLRDRAAAIARAAAPNLNLNNQILAVNVPADPVLSAAEVRRLVQVINQRPGVAVASRYQNGTVIVQGAVPNLAEAQQLTQALQRVPGVETVISTVQKQNILATRFYFGSNSSQIASSQATPQLQALGEFLAQNPDLHLRMIGYSDEQGETTRNQTLAIARALEVKKALVTVGQVDHQRLHTSSGINRPPGVVPEQPLWLSRCVRLEVFMPPVPP
jgi:outer membrane protein OmpA-like peptidoglycan-associated protein